MSKNNNEILNKVIKLPVNILDHYGTIQEVKDGIVIVKEGLKKVCI